MKTICFYIVYIFPTKMIVMSLVISCQLLQISYYGSRAQLEVASTPRTFEQHGLNRAYDVLETMQIRRLVD